MIRGIERVVAADAMEVGRFYLMPAPQMEPTLFQCVGGDFGKTGAGRMALVYPYEGASPAPIELQDTDWYEVLVAMPQVSVRVDPPSAIEVGSAGRVPMNTLIIAGDEPYFAVKIPGYRNYTLINLGTGQVADQRTLSEWISFSRWSLVVDEAGEEVTIATFDAA